MPISRHSHLLNLCGAVMVALGLVLTGCKIEKVETAGSVDESSQPDDGGDAVKKSDGGTIRVGFVTNGIDPFWTIAGAGAKAA